MNRSTPGLPVHHQLPSSLRLTSTESVMPSSHLILCRPLLLLPPIPPSIRVFSSESTIRECKSKPQCDTTSHPLCYVASVVSDSLQPCGLQLTRLLCPWGFPGQEYWSGLPCPPPGVLPDAGIEPAFAKPADTEDRLYWTGETG